MPYKDSQRTVNFFPKYFGSFSPFAASSKNFFFYPFIFQSDIYGALGNEWLPDIPNPSWLVCLSWMTTFASFSGISRSFCALYFQDGCCIPCEKQRIKWRFFSATCITGCFQLCWWLLIFPPLSRVKVMQNFKIIIKAWNSSYIDSDYYFLLYLP